MRTVAVTMLVVMMACKHPEPNEVATPSLVDHTFAGCVLVQRQNWQPDNWQCENAEGLWKCTEPVRTSCLWAGPLPAGHPLLRVEERVASTVGSSDERRTTP